MQRRIVPDIIRGPQVLLELPADANVRGAARAMRDSGVGSVLITENGRLLGIFTERDLVHRVVACAKDPDSTSPIPSARKPVRWMPCA
jgi:CBS domain-containing protein